jgi:hypothetical protein
MKALLSNEEIGGALVAFLRGQQRIPLDAEVTRVTLVVAYETADHRAEIEWQPANSSGSTAKQTEHRKDNSDPRSHLAEAGGDDVAESGAPVESAGGVTAPERNP